MDARIARLVSDVAHIRSDLGEVKSDVRSLRGTIDSLRDRIDSLRDKMDERFAVVDAKIDGVKDSLASAKVWALVLYIALAGSSFGTLARGFGWI
jgi:hypothetical protein